MSITSLFRSKSNTLFKKYGDTIVEHLFQPKSFVKLYIEHYYQTALFSLISICWFATPAVACVDPYARRFLFLERLPRKDYGANFIGRIRIEKVTQQDYFQLITATILPTSCHPSINISDRGLVMGKTVKGLSDNVVVPFESQDYMREGDFQSLEVGRILHTDEGSFYLDEAESYP